MTKKKSHLTDEDRALWKSVSHLVEPHKKTDTHRKKRSFKTDDDTPTPSTSKPASKGSVKPAPKKKWENIPHQPAPLSITKTHASAPQLAAIADDVAGHIKSKKRSIDARLDLHGMTQEMAHRKAIAFINSSYARQLKTILVITGKGKNAVAVAPFGAEQSRNITDGILQKNLPRWLAAEPATAKHIAGISQAPRDLGGSGAFVITLKRQR